MTTKERIYTALMGQMPDRVPFTIYSGIATAEDGYDDLIAQGMGFMASCHVYNTRHPNVEVTHKVISINFPSSVHITEPEEIRDTTIQLLREAAPGNGFVIGVTENVPRSVGTRSLEVIMETVNEYGNCPISGN